VVEPEGCPLSMCNSPLVGVVGYGRNQRSHPSHLAGRFPLQHPCIVRSSAQSVLRGGPYSAVAHACSSTRRRRKSSFQPSCIESLTNEGSHGHVCRGQTGKRGVNWRVWDMRAAAEGSGLWCAVHSGLYKTRQKMPQASMHQPPVADLKTAPTAQGRCTPSRFGFFFNMQPNALCEICHTYCEAAVILWHRAACTDSNAAFTDVSLLGNLIFALQSNDWQTQLLSSETALHAYFLTFTCITDMHRGITSVDQQDSVARNRSAVVPPSKFPDRRALLHSRISCRLLSTVTLGTSTVGTSTFASPELDSHQICEIV
jgi:hypothetical protein